MQYSSKDFGSNKSCSPPPRSSGTTSRTGGSSGASQRVVVTGTPQLETKGYANREKTQERIRANLRESNPELSGEQIDRISETTLQSFSDEIREQQNKNRDMVPYAPSLPAGTQWKDVKLVVSKFENTDVHTSQIEIFVTGKRHGQGSFADFLFTDTNLGTISQSGKILYLLGMNTQFGWTDGINRSTIGKQKERLEDDLRQGFGLEGDAFSRENSLYTPIFKIETKCEEPYENMSDRFIYDLLKDPEVFSSQ